MAPFYRRTASALDPSHPRTAEERWAQIRGCVKREEREKKKGTEKLTLSRLKYLAEEKKKKKFGLVGLVCSNKRAQASTGRPLIGRFRF